MEGGSSTGGGTSTPSMEAASAAGSGGAGDEVKPTVGGLETFGLGGGVERVMGGLGGVSLCQGGMKTGREGVSSGRAVSLTGAGATGVGLSGINAGGGVKAGQSGIEEGGAISTGDAASGMAGMMGRRALEGEASCSGFVSPLSGGTGISGACPGSSEVGASRMESAWTNAESFFVFLKPRKPFFPVVALGGGVAATSSAVLPFLSLSFFCLGSSFSFSLLPLVSLSLPFFSFPSLLSFFVGRRGFLLSSFSSLKTTLGATTVLFSRVWLMVVSREGRAPAGR